MLTMRTAIDPTLLSFRELVPDDAGDVEKFSCGDEDLDDFLRTDALRLQESHVVRTYLAFYDSELMGYISLLTDVIKLESPEKKKLSLRHDDHPMVPALKLARLAVAQRLRGTLLGLGTALVRFAYDKAVTLSEEVGCRLLTVDAYSEAVGFYEKLGFTRSKGQNRKRGDLTGQGTNQEEISRPSMWFDLFVPEPPAWLIGEGT